MPQLVFMHGPGAGAYSDAYYYQLKHFPDCVAPTLRGHLEGSPCPDVARYTEWVRGWLWALGVREAECEDLRLTWRRSLGQT